MIRLYKVVTTLLSLLALWQVTEARERNITGILRDESGQTLAGATVIVGNARHYITTS